ncbi:prephenate/arogenate dehydrogenase [Aerosakkonema funiforme]|uniref:Prephenate/arogenate dehydrogenase n=1 Tax=Aerosakkonema funiforme FACHB-1375 TaxID=2949571 RepID=A0A926ZFZ9_9CYAN|nr:prephenate/arogenate dehydrogenase [Aerosakkonema funiforme]MBD2181658.1 prephenate/arogenate dehydrogenase [Aerosakkonema funiforme FACHB-1375]
MKIGIVGLGLIGGSLALDLRNLGHRVLGVSRRDRTCQEAIARQIVDDASVNLSLLADTDIVFICTPLGAIIPTFEALISHLSPNTIVTDVGSVKTPIVKALAPIWPNFVGGHPMAGTAESGLDAAISNLFAGNPYVLTPTETTPTNAIKVVEEIVRSLQAKFYICRPEDHDKAVAWISHLPVMVSAGLIDACMSETNPNVLELAKNLASSGFRDTSRVGGGNPELGVMMARYNRDALLRSLQQYRQSLDRLIADIEREDWQELEDKLKRNQQSRPDFIAGKNFS